MAEEKGPISIIEKKKQTEEALLKELKEIEKNIIEYYQLDAHVRWEYYTALRDEGFDREQAMDLVRNMQIIEDEE